MCIVLLVQRKDWYTFAQLPQAYACSKILRYLYAPTLRNSFKACKQCNCRYWTSPGMLLDKNTLCAAYTNVCSREMHNALQALDSVAGVPTDCGAHCGSHRLDGLALHTSYDLLPCDLTSQRRRLMLCRCVTGQQLRQ